MIQVPQRPPNNTNEDTYWCSEGDLNPRDRLRSADFQSDFARNASSCNALYTPA